MGRPCEGGRLHTPTLPFSLECHVCNGTGLVPAPVTSDETALLAAIIAQPDEDTPRLVYADWLAQHGDERRAEFVRVQCRIAAVARGDVSGDLPALFARERDLWPREVWRWPDEVVWRRGFVDEVVCSPGAWFNYGDEARASHPVARVRLTALLSMDTVTHIVNPAPPPLDSFLIADRWVNFCDDDIDVADPPDTYWKMNCFLNRLLFQRRWPGVTFELPA
ncbi:hypothetical protein C1280_35335 [Gemmata obscuriglobus]|uniref:TIGR02996 domain-containing protein n=2 Tax=Gemmata obscuriglobus TaxID=114 RepID=A0A2Z3H902_9BACT|nr:hypothetical protein C1280_35335 [Gemmata obscuriglobus]